MSEQGGEEAGGTLHPADQLYRELLETIDRSETADDEDILNAVANLLASAARAACVSPAVLLANLGKLMGAHDVHVEKAVKPRGTA